MVWSGLTQQIVRKLFLCDVDEGGTASDSTGSDNVLSRGHIHNGIAAGGDHDDGASRATQFPNTLEHHGTIHVPQEGPPG